MLSKIIIDYLVKKLTEKELTLNDIKDFEKTVLVPQGAKNLSEHFKAAEEIFIQQEQMDETNEKNN